MSGRMKTDVYCQSGRTSAIAAHTLVALGYRDVWNLEGGLLAWQRAGFRLQVPGGARR
jgi:rhodanese-related sulfurtransferase